MRCPWYRPEALRIKGMLLVSNDLQEAERLLQTSIAEAHCQGALAWELRSATSLAGLWRDRGRGADAQSLLAPIYGRFTEGFATADLKAAQSLLAELALRSGLSDNPGK